MQRFFLIGVLCACFMVNAQSPASANVDAWVKLSATSKIYLDYSDDANLFYPDADLKVPALVQFSNAALGVPQEVKVEAWFGRIASVRIDRDGLMALLNDPNVEYVDISCRLNRVKMMNDTARVLSQVNQVQQGLSYGLPANYNGKDVIVGIVDVGFEPDNPTNFNNDGSVYRVKRFWQQNDKSGAHPAGFNYGTESKTSTAILAARDDDGTHATHVTGIAGGSGFTTPQLKYRGMAPECDLVFVSIKYSNDTIGGSAQGDYIVANPTILDGFKYVFDYAESVGKPAVLNLSWGMHTGPHDGTSLFDKAVENLTGPGKILVGANGNDAGNQMHISDTLAGDTLYTFAIDRSRNDYVHESIYCDFWGDSAKTLGINLSLFDTLGNKLLETPFYYSDQSTSVKKTFASGTDTIWFTLAANKKYTNNSKPEILLMAETNYAKNQRIRIGFTGHGRFDGWNSGQVKRWTAGSFLSKVKGNDKTGLYLDGLVEGSMGENGGTGKATISVGAYTARNNWLDTAKQYHAQSWLKVGEIAGFSSRGPTVDGRIKPDIAAPGQNIISSVNYRQFAPWMMENTPLITTYNGNPQYWTMLSGTSMASPHVCGIVALMLQVNPNLDPAQVKKILYQTAQRDIYTGNDSNVVYGYGKINAFSAVKTLVNLNVKDPGHKGSKCKLFPVPASEAVWISSALFAGKSAMLTITDITGKQVADAKIFFDGSGLAQFETGSIASGSYEWTLEQKGVTASGRLIVLH